VSSWGDQDDTESIAAIRYAVESGVNWIDTAAVYGLGHSEGVVAAALVGLPEADQPYVFTKAGLVWDPADRSATPRRRRPGQPASRGRGLAAPPAGRADRPLPAALARR
jgi:aryl-alcohol dehydrogenase-like predicted oxidoreductase